MLKRFHCLSHMGEPYLIEFYSRIFQQIVLLK